MPIYEYACQACGHEFEAIQKMVDLPLEQCPVCAENTLKKKISAAGFRLKGTGWYETDFKNKKQPVDKNKSVDNKKDEKVDAEKSASTASTGSSETTKTGSSETAKNTATCVSS
ncbi:MAG: zinc ribbon domain-containing protein [Thioploca sp.]|nr:zinc ribbon domain-containing protein [Thioploca sp.]